MPQQNNSAGYTWQSSFLHIKKGESNNVQYGMHKYIAKDITLLSVVA